MQIFQYMNRLNPIYLDCMRRGVIDRLPSGVDYHFLQNDPYNCKINNGDPRTPSEELRVRLAIDNPDMMWIDSDVAIKSWPTFDLGGKPYFAQEANRHGEYFFYVNGCTSFFMELLEDFKKMTTYDNYWLLNAVRARKDDVYTIPKEHFVHCRLSTTHLTTGNWTETGGEGYRLLNDHGKYSLELKL